MTRHRLPRLLAILMLSAVSASPGFAQSPAATTAPAENGQALKPAQTADAAKDSSKSPGACAPEAAKAEAATATQGSPDDGTAPENSGSTGWTGGTGGSMIGTNPSGAVRTTQTWHSPTARGLDLKGRAEPAPAC